MKKLIIILLLVCNNKANSQIGSNRESVAKVQEMVALINKSDKSVRVSKKFLGIKYSKWQKALFLIGPECQKIVISSLNNRSVCIVESKVINDSALIQDKYEVQLMHDVEARLEYYIASNGELVGWVWGVNAEQFSGKEDTFEYCKRMVMYLKNRLSADNYSVKYN